ncbi:hypothetical protein ACSDR0_15675 [Streptosporangium sp. G11]|uniref:hypothetical protein n=1 Tax=Streptosporangium sp. G11 TaxID=3436926 RepID=UPI003EB9729B
MMASPQVTDRVTDPLSGPSRVFPGDRRVLGAALVLVVAQLVWRAAILQRGGFFGDDLNMVGRAAAEPFGLDYLFGVYSAHVMPVGMIANTVVTSLGAYNWTVTAAALLLFQLAASLAVYRMLRVLFGARWAILVPLSLYLFTPLALPAFYWWAAAVQALPLQAAIAMAVASHVTFLRSGRGVDALVTGLWFLFGLGSFHLKAVFAIPLLLVMITVLYFPVRERLRSLATAFGAYAVMAGAYSILFFLQLDRLHGQAIGAPASEVAGRAMARMLGVTLPVLAAGGPGPWWYKFYAVPPPLLIGASWLLIAVVVAVTLVFRRGAWKAWLILCVYPPLLMVPILAGRSLDRALGEEARYLADVTPVLALCLALATLPLLGEARPYRSRIPARAAVRAGCVLLAAGVAAFSVYSAQRYVTGTEPGRAEIRSYLASVRTTLASAPPGSDVYPQQTPYDQFGFGYGDEGLSHLTLSPLAPPELAALMRNPRPATAPLVLDATGRRLVPARLTGPYVAAPGGCFPQRGGLISIPLAHKGGMVVLGLDYRSTARTAAYVHVGEQEVEIVLEQGAGRIHIPFTAPGASVRVEVLSPDTQVCVIGGLFGGPVPF